MKKPPLQLVNLKIDSLKLCNFKSIKNLDLKFNDINIFIGSNGVGKSNLISFFYFLNKLIDKNLQAHISRSGGSDNILHFGKKISKNLSTEINFKYSDYYNKYSFVLEPNIEDGFFFLEENIFFRKNNNTNWIKEELGSGHLETKLFEHKKDNSDISSYITSALLRFKVYHFHDTSSSALVKQTGEIADNYYLKEDASNLAAFLYMLENKYPENFKKIQNTIKLIAPFFDRFDLKPSVMNPEKIRLEWREVNSEKYFNANHLSDGTLRMICLVSLLLQPEPHNTIIIDEPELGLHPYAINVLASIIKSISNKVQIILSTQSVTLINQFTPEDIIVVDRKNGQSVFRRIEKNELDNWLDDYSLGDVWEKNLIGGRP